LHAPPITAGSRGISGSALAPSHDAKRFASFRVGGQLHVLAVAAVEVQLAAAKDGHIMSLSNSLGLLGRKVGMMRLFTDDGDAVPVTVVDVSNNRVTQVKNQDNDGYVALQVTLARARLRA
jgi:hypothetical protein